MARSKKDKTSRKDELFEIKKTKRKDAEKQAKKYIINQQVADITGDIFIKNLSLLESGL